MKSLATNAHLSFQEVFASTLIHSLWQGAIIVLLVWMLRMSLVKNSKLNYIISLLSLIVLVLTSIVTFLILWSENTLGFYSHTILTKVLDKPDVLKWFNNIWLFGASLFFFRFILSHVYLNKLIRQSKPILNTQWIEIFNQLKNYYSIHKSIVLLQSEKVSSAFLTGVIRPVIIVPTAWLNELSLKEAECILAHELSHLCNRDHLVNLFIHFSEIIFYFNPAVHILIGHIKLERELKADSSACNYLKEPMLYAKLILKIEESIGKVPVNAVPFFEQKKQLKRRIESVLRIKSSANEFTSRIALFALTLSLLFFSSLTVKNPSTEILSEVILDKEECESKAFPKIKSANLKRDIVHRQVPKVITSNKKETSEKIKMPVEENVQEEIIAYAENERHHTIAFETDDTENILQKIENEIREEQNRMTIIYEISKTEADSERVINGSNLLVPRQIRYYAPNETKTYIIIKSRKNTNFEPEMDWNTPGRVKIMSGNRH